MTDSLDERQSSNDDGYSRTQTFHASTQVPQAHGRARKRSLHLTLVFIGAAALAGCGGLERDSYVNRDVYKNLEECRADWGNPEDCEEIDEKRSATGSRSYYGPRYSSHTGHYGYSSIPRPGSRSQGSVSNGKSGSSASRGGFGSSASRHGGGSYSG